MFDGSKNVYPSFASPWVDNSKWLILSIKLSTVFIILDSTNIVALANLCQEYQIDWLLDEIEFYLNVLDIEDLNTQLEHLQLAQKMGFEDDTETNLVYNINTYFPVIRSNPLFALLHLSVKLKITFMRLRILLDPFINRDKTGYTVDAKGSDL